MNERLAFINKNKANILLLFIWTIIVLIAMFHHEIWRDEAQVWLLARDCNFIELLKQSRIEGHPILWYLLVMPFAKLGMDVISMQILSVFAVFLGVAYLLFKSPFNIFMKFLFIFSAGLTYYLPVIARNYALIPIFLFLLANIYPNKGECYKHPYQFAILLILLSNTHLFMLIFCIVQAVFFIWEQIKIPEKTFKILLPSILLIINFSILILIFYNLPHINRSIIDYSNEYCQTMISAIQGFALLFFQYPFITEKYSNIYIFSFYILLSILCIKLFQKDKKLFISFVAMFVYFFILYKQIWYEGVNYQKTFLLFLILIFSYWIINKTEKDKLLQIIILLISGIGFIHTPFCVYSEITTPFSETKQLTEYIKQNLNDEKVFILNSRFYYYTSLFAYLKDKSFYSLQFNKYMKYYNFLSNNDSKTEEKPDAEYGIEEIDDSTLFEDEGFKHEVIFETDMQKPKYVNARFLAEDFRIYKRIKISEDN